MNQIVGGGGSTDIAEFAETNIIPPNDTTIAHPILIEIEVKNHTIDPDKIVDTGTRIDDSMSRGNTGHNTVQSIHRVVPENDTNITKPNDRPTPVVINDPLNNKSEHHSMFARLLPIHHFTTRAYFTTVVPAGGRHELTNNDNEKHDKPNCMVS